MPMTTKASASARTRAACSSRKSTRSGPAASSTENQPRLSWYCSSPASTSASRGAAAWSRCPRTSSVRPVRPPEKVRVMSPMAQPSLA